MDDSDLKRSPYYFSLKRPVTATMIMLTAVVFGFLSYRLLPVNIMPEISYPSITVRTEYPGSAPEEVENVVTKPLEQTLSVVRNLVEISSISRAGYSDVLLEFDWDVNIDQVTQDVREKLDLVFLPEDVKPPLILRYDPSLDPLMRMGFTTDSLDLLELRELIENLVKRELVKLSGVAAVKVKGGEEYEIRVKFSELLLSQYDISFEQIAQKLASENINIPGGRLKEGEAEYIIRTLNEFRGINEIEDIIIKAGDEKTVRLKDIAEVKKTAKDKLSLTKVKQSKSVEIEIYKEFDANPINVSTLVQNRIWGLKKQREADDEPPRNNRSRRSFIPLSETLTERIEVHILSDQAEFIRLAVNEVRSSAIYGGLLAILILLLFLGRLRDTLVVAIVIPVSLLCTFAAMHLAKISINIMSLGGLALGIGMMVDNAIVVSESIHRRIEAGEKAVLSAVKGAQIVGGAVTASTLTTIVVFSPIVFVTGVAGQIFGDMALAVIISLLISLIVALFYIPMLFGKPYSQERDNRKSYEWGKPKTKFLDPWRSFKKNLKNWLKLNIILKIVVFPVWIVYAVFSLGFGFIIRILQYAYYFILFLIRFVYLKSIVFLVDGLSNRSGAIINAFRMFVNKSTVNYGRLLQVLIKHPAAIVGFAILFCIGSFGLILPNLGGELIPSISQGIFDLKFELPIGSSLDETSEKIQPIEYFLAELPEVEKFSTRIGSDIAGEEEFTGANNALITVKLKSGGDLEMKEKSVVQKTRRFIDSIPSLEMIIAHPTLFTFKKPIEIIIKKEDLAELKSLTNTVAKQLEANPILRDIESSVRFGHPEIVIRFDRDKLARIGLNAQIVAERIRTAFHGKTATRFREEEKRLDIRIVAFKEREKSLQSLKNLIINPEHPIPVRLSEVSSINVEEGPASIRHFSGERSSIITASIFESDLKTAGEAITQILAKLNLLEGYDYVITGQRREMEDSLESLRLALLLAVFLVYVVLASQFESFRAPFIILLTAPIAVVSVFPVLWLMEIPLSIMVFLGLIVLVGIVVNNSIVLVDYFQRLYKSGDDFVDAIVNAAKARFRPILMTSLTTIFALTPMALGVGEGVEIRRPMAITVIFGLLFGTLATLFVIPALVKLTLKKKQRLIE